MDRTEISGQAPRRGFYSTRPQSLVGVWETLPATGALGAGAVFGPYRLKSKLGEGGMGVVWLAEQSEPFQREVAIKLLAQKLKGGLAEAYFQVERQALAQLRHPYIAQIHDAGTLPDGALFFAMEYVEGVPLDYFAEQRAASLDAIVELLIRVCQGVQYAHQRGLIHRDLKPANVLVVEVGGEHLPKIIDFGVAVGVSASDPIHVEAEHAVGTYAYMAPEQSDPTPAGIDARADVYALGAILGECICLHLKIRPDAAESTARSLRAGVIQSLGRFDPDGLQSSERLSRELQAVPHTLRAILLKATHTDRNQRYDTAAALADDLERYRSHQPVRAMDASRWYTLKCFVRRNRLATAAAAGILLALMGGIVIALLGLREAQSARALAEERRASAEQLIGYMLGDFADKLRPLGKLDLLDGVSGQAMKYLGSNEQTAETPISALRRATALRTLAEVQIQRNQIDDARGALTQAARLIAQIPASTANTEEVLVEKGTTAYWIGYLHFQANELDEAEKQWQRYLTASQALIPLTPKTSKGLIETAFAENNLATLASRRGQTKLAIEKFESVVTLQEKILQTKPDDLELTQSLANSYSWLARAHNADSNLTAGRNSFLTQLRLIKTVRTRDPNAALWRWHEAIARYWLGLSELDLGRISDAEEQFERSQKLLSDLTDHDATQQGWKRDLAFTELLLGSIALYAGQPDRARGILTRAKTRLAPLLLSEQVQAGWRRLDARIDYRLAQCDQELGNPSAASQSLAQAQSTLSALTQQNAKDPANAVAMAHVLIDTALQSSSSPRAALLARASAVLQPFAESTGDASVLDPWARILALTGNKSAFEVTLRRLDKIGYREPGFRSFVESNSTKEVP